MLNVTKKEIKTIDDYRHSIKLLKYHLKKQAKTNQNLQYEYAKSKRKQKYKLKTYKNIKAYSLTDTVKTVCDRLKRMGLVLSDVFRMADHQYEGQINKEQFMKTLFKLRTDLDQSLFNELFYAIDTSLNGLISQDEFQEFSLAYGGGANPKQLRRFQKKTMSKLGGLIIRKHSSVQIFMGKFDDPVKISTFRSELKDLGLSDNETMLMLKTFDPSQEGQIKQKVFLSLMSDIKFKSQKQQQNEEYEKGIQDLCVQWRQRNLNPIDIFEEADVDGQDGVSPFELEQAFKKLMPGETTFQIKKWVDMINLNNDNEITKDEFLNSIRCFYSLNQMSKFSTEYEKRHPRKEGEKEEQSIQDIMKELSIKIEDSGMTKKEVFHFIDYDKSGEVSKEEMVDGLKTMGMHVGFIGRVMSVFDRDSSGNISFEEWCHLLGEDVSVSEVPIPDDVDFSDFDDQTEKGEKSKTKSKAKPKEKPKQKEKQKQKEKPKQEKNKTIKSKVVENQVEKKENKNKTTKDSVKKPPVKIAEDSIKEDKKNKTIQKKKKEPVIQQEQPIQQANNADQIEESIAKQYKRNKKAYIKHFRKADPKKTNILSMKKFYQCLRSAYPSIAQTEEKEIFMKYCIGGSQINYYDWLQEIADMHAAEIEQQGGEQSSGESEAERRKQEQIEREREEKRIQKQKEQKRKQKQSEETKIKKSKIIIKDEEQNEKNKIKKSKIIIKDDEQNEKNKIKQSKIEVKNEEKNPKRGQGLKAFQELLTLQMAEGEKKQQTASGAYKLIDYIDEEGEHVEERKKLLEKAKKIKEKGKVYKDSEFPPQIKSLTSNPNKSHIQNVTLLKWKHYTEIFKNPQLFAGSIEPNDIKQGSLGNCYFLSSLACLAEYKNMIERLFEYYDLENGYFLIWLCIDGTWKLFEVDGYIPVNPKGTDPIFSRTTQEQLWVIILEKAYAKAYGDYDKIVGGQPYEAIKDLSGGPGIQMKHDKISINDIWKRLFEANKYEYMMTGGTKMEDTGKRIDGHQEGVTDEGIVLGHAYSILDMQEVKNDKILQLRNPWGQTQWLGEWSDKSSKWTEELRRKVKYTISDDDGIFWMPLPAFYKNFVSSSINYIRPTYYYRSYKQTNIRQLAIKLKISFTDGYLMVSQKDHRHEGLPVNTPYSLLNLIGFVYCDGKVIKKLDDRKFLYEREGLIEYKNMNQYPENSQAILLINLEKSCNIVVGYYGDKEVQFQIDNQLIKYLEQLAYMEENSPNTQAVAGKMKIWLTEVQGIGFLCFKNTSGEKFSLNVNVPNPQNLKVLPPCGAKNVLQMNPGQCKCVKGKVVNLQQGFNFHQQIFFAQ